MTIPLQRLNDLHGSGALQTLMSRLPQQRDSQLSYVEAATLSILIDKSA
ncbi:hypothetical protein GPAL_3456 [Glaciecola pallidula DSM 14239 = ACAM 615]|uniref:Uncharacterized protein n=1 Tax=Brumicola pallidula DSM 14239 = ACAM 615 TaxID=1121922 RepID=K6YC70_9ALTE|nr:hypothetical protein GPAL_3456 [Glaciecola pallidula DSM 14239 = ACAM 615]